MAALHRFLFAADLVVGLILLTPPIYFFVFILFIYFSYLTCLLFLLIMWWVWLNMWYLWVVFFFYLGSSATVFTHILYFCFLSLFDLRCCTETLLHCSCVRPSCEGLGLLWEFGDKIENGKKETGKCDLGVSSLFVCTVVFFCEKD